MKIISHRGNINGVVSEKENRPSYIDCALGLGYDVEVDIRYIDNKFWLGHDEPQYQLNEKWMLLRKDKLWFHCKNLDSSIKIQELSSDLKFFCHKQDDYVLTSVGKFWVHDLTNKIDQNCIIPLLSLTEIHNYDYSKKPFAICTDYINDLKKYYYV